jgi:hypothetical protein
LKIPSLKPCAKASRCAAARSTRIRHSALSARISFALRDLGWDDTSFITVSFSVQRVIVPRS